MATVKLSAGKYNTSESVGFKGVQVCADLFNGTLQFGESLQVNFVLSNGSALQNRKSWTINLKNY